MFLCDLLELASVAGLWLFLLFCCYLTQQDCDCMFKLYDGCVIVSVFSSLAVVHLFTMPFSCCVVMMACWMCVQVLFCLLLLLLWLFFVTNPVLILCSLMLLLSQGLWLSSKMQAFGFGTFLYLRLFLETFRFLQMLLPCFESHLMCLGLPTLEGLV